jgi:hypothetical protein
VVVVGALQPFPYMRCVACVLHAVRVVHVCKQFQIAWQVGPDG